MASERHPATQHLLEQFGYEHLPPHLRAVSKPFRDLAINLLTLTDGPELSAGLRKLLEAKDCCVRQAVIDARNAVTATGA
ncbi:MAG: hypothetical protein ACPGVG_18095 [Mycobacterium sp.]